MTTEHATGQHQPEVSQLLKNSTRDGFFYSLMVALGETFLVAYGLSLGIHERNAALIATLPVVLGSICQVLVFRRAKSLDSARVWVVVFAVVQACVLYCIPLAGAFGSYSYIFLIIAATIYWTAGFSAGPVWNGWVTAILPRERQKSFFYRRNAISQLTILTGILAAGLILKVLDTQSLGYIVIFLLAGTARLVSGLFLSRHPDAVNFPFSQVSAAGGAMRQLLQQPFVRNGLFFSFFTNFAVHISSPFFSPYMLKKLALQPAQYSVLIAAAFFARSLSGYVLEHLLHIRQNQVMFKVGVLGVILMPALWTVSDHYGYLICLQMLGGFFWGCHELGLTMLLIEKIESSSRLRILSLTNLIASLGMVGGMIAGWTIAASDEIPKETYHLLFTASSILRLVPVVFLLPYIQLAESWQPAFRTLGVRPTGQGILKPIITDDIGPSKETE